MNPLNNDLNGWLVINKDLGTSISCNGVCLTLTKIKKGLIFFAAACCSGPFLPDNINAI